MNATELFHSDGKPANVFYCGECRRVSATQLAAERCCQNHNCLTCGQDTGSRSWMVCDTCRAIKATNVEAERFNKAEKLSKWGGWVYCAGLYAETIDELLDDLEPSEFPEYVWACSANHFVQADISDIEMQMLDGAYEDFEFESLSGIDELKTAILRFNEANKDVVSYNPDYSKAVLVGQLTKP